MEKTKIITEMVCYIIWTILGVLFIISWKSDYLKQKKKGKKEFLEESNFNSQIYEVTNEIERMREELEQVLDLQKTYLRESIKNAKRT